MQVEFLGEKIIPVNETETILKASLQADIPHFHACNGNAQCSTCRVLVVEGTEYLSPPNGKEQQLKEKMHFPPNVRLACQTFVTGEAVKLRRIIQDETDIDLYIGEEAGLCTQKLGEETELALFFLDIRNFTPFVETHLAFDVIHIIRKLFSVLQKIIEQNGGRIVETSGDGLYAVFGFEETDNSKIAQCAIEAGNAILTNLENLNQTYFLTHFEQNMQVGIGIHIGKVVSGAVMVGNQSRPIIMGLPVNIASRIQAATKELNNNFIVSADVYNLVPNTPAKDQKTIFVKGVSTPLTVYLLGNPYGPANE